MTCAKSAAIQFVALVTAGALASPVVGGEIKLELGTLQAMELTEQDVFVEAADGAVRRIPPAEVEAMMDAALFGADTPPPFEPMNLEPTDNYGKGIHLGITLREWLAASGTGTYACEDGKSVFNVTLSGLRPSAVYTMWNFIDAEPPTDPWQGIIYPLGARDGSDATFESDADGNAVYSAIFEPCVELSGTQTLSGIAAAWHPDGKTHGASPGKLGVDAFAQVMGALMP